MARFMLAGAAVAMAATPALAAPGFGSSSWVTNSSGASSDVDEEAVSLFATLLSLYNISFDSQISSKPGKSSGDAGAKAPECEQAKKAEEEKLAEAKKRRASGPEPVYLAF